MRWSFNLLTIAGTQIRVHITFLLLVGWLAFSASETGGMPAAARVTLFLLAVFLCILLHEFGHILMARRFGIRTPEVLLSPIGGLARLERMPDDPGQELLVALAGPAVTAVLVAIFWAILELTGGSVEPVLLRESVLPGLLPGLMWVNIYLLAFNLIPAFPMDGGRVLRALLARRKGMLAGTRIAVRIGQGFAIVLGLLALFGPVPNPILLLIAGFIFLAAQAESTMVETRAAGQGIRASQMMVTDFRVLRSHATLRDAAEALLTGEQREFPIVDELSRLKGLLTRDHLIRGLTDQGPEANVQTVMAPVTETVPVQMAFDQALDRLRRSGLPALPVVGDDGSLVGLLTLDNITDLLLIRRAAGEI